MITEKVSDNQKVTVNETPVDNYRTMGDSVYSAESTACSQEYRNYLEGLLNNQGVAVPEVEYEDALRYLAENKQEERVATNEESTANANVTPAATPAPQKAEAETVRVFNQKRAIWLVVYILLAIGVVLTLLFTMPGTAWERKSITVDKSNMYPVAEASETAPTVAAINTIYTLDGQKITVDVTPKAEDKPQTNWFDNLCDWLNNTVGGN